MSPDDLEKMSAEERVARGMKMADEYYEFFRLGGAFGWKEFQRLDSLQKGACALARKKIKEEEARFNMKCMMAVFESAVSAMIKGPAASPEDVILTPGDEVTKSGVQEACSSELAKMMDGGAK